MRREKMEGWEFTGQCGGEGGTEAWTKRGMKSKDLGLPLRTRPSAATWGLPGILHGLCQQRAPRAFASISSLGTKITEQQPLGKFRGAGHLRGNPGSRFRIHPPGNGDGRLEECWLHLSCHRPNSDSQSLWVHVCSKHHQATN